jgi:hypothetical protein
VALDHVWRYQQTASLDGSGWEQPDYDDASWPQGPGLLAEETNPLITPLIKTPLSLGRITYYFRTHFEFPSNTTGVSITFSNRIDDGAIIYLNGVPEARVRMPEGTVSSSTLGQLPPNGDSLDWDVVTIGSSHLRRGDNVLAVEVHQAATNSSDIVWGAEVWATLPFAPVFQDATQPTNRTVLQGRSSTLLASVLASPPVAFQWFKDCLPLPDGTNNSYVITNMTASDAGSYFCRVIGTEGMLETRTAFVNYVPDQEGPRLLYALGNDNLTEVAVEFSEPVDAFSATDIFNYIFYARGAPNDFLIPNTVILVDATTVVLLTDPAVPGREYVLEVSGVTDAAAANLLWPNPSTLAVAFPAVVRGFDDPGAWRFDQVGVDRGTAWRHPGYDDSGWEVGTGLFEARLPPRVEVNGLAIHTALSLTSTNAPATRTPTYYFRTRRSVLQLRTVLDDGAVFYLNGEEALRLGITNQAVAFTNFASRLINNATNEGPFSLPLTNLVQGDNVLAVEVHQANAASSDLTFGAMLTLALTNPRTPLQTREPP